MATEETYAGESKILAQARKDWERVKECTFEKGLREQSTRNLKYFTGEDQGWDDENARSDREAEGRPAITLNKENAMVRLICGVRPHTEARFQGNEEGDVESAEIIEACKDHVEKTNKWEFLEEDVFKHGIILERVVLELQPDYDFDIRGEIEYEMGTDNWYFDPDSKKADRSDGMFAVKKITVSPAEAKRLFPKMKGKLDELVGYVENDTGDSSRDSKEVDEYQDTRSSFYDPATNKLTILYYWYRIIKPITKIIDTAALGTGGEDSTVYDSTKDAEDVKKTLKKLGPDAVDRYQVITTQDTQVKYLVFCHDIELEKGDTPWNRKDGRKTKLSSVIPAIPWEPDRIMAGTRRHLISLMEAWHDPQKYHNKLASSVLEIIGTSASSGWEYEDGAVTPAWLKKLKEWGRKPGFVMEWTKGAISGNRARKITSTGGPQAEMAMAKEMSDSLLDVSGIEALVNANSLGKGASGVAVDLKQRQGGNVVEWIYRSFTAYEHTLTELVLDAIQVLFDYEKVVRIKGQGMSFQPRNVRINERVYDEMGAITETLNDVTMGRYDFSLIDKEVLPTARIERFKYFVELVKSGALQLPPPVLTTIIVHLMEDPELKDLVKKEYSNFMQNLQQQPQGGQPQPQQGQPQAAA